MEKKVLINNKLLIKINKKKGKKMSKVTYSVPAIHCQHCVHTIEMELGELDGVETVKADFNAKTVEVEFDEPASEDLIIGTLREIEYPPEVN